MGILPNRPPPAFQQGQVGVMLPLLLGLLPGQRGLTLAAHACPPAPHLPAPLPRSAQPTPTSHITPFSQSPAPMPPALLSLPPCQDLVAMVTDVVEEGGGRFGLWGVTPGGGTVHVRVADFHPYFYIAAPKRPVRQRFLCSALCAALQSMAVLWLGVGAWEGHAPPVLMAGWRAPGHAEWGGAGWEISYEPPECCTQAFSTSMATVAAAQWRWCGGCGVVCRCSRRSGRPAHRAQPLHDTGRPGAAGRGAAAPAHHVLQVGLIFSHSEIYNMFRKMSLERGKLCPREGAPSLMRLCCRQPRLSLLLHFAPFCRCRRPSNPGGDTILKLTFPAGANLRKASAHLAKAMAAGRLQEHGLVWRDTEMYEAEVAPLQVL